jgi:NADH oxidase (H2O2-forming)
MKTTDVAIIGGSAAGLMAAVTVKKYYPDKKVTVIRNVKKTPVPCGIPYIYGVLKDVEKNIIPDQGFIDKGIDILKVEVESVDRERKTISFTDNSVLTYDKLILGVGSKPFMPPMPGIYLKNVFVVSKDPEYLQQLFIALQGAKNVVVIGGGFIGVEMAEQVAKMGGAVIHDHVCDPDESGSSIKVTIVEMLPHCLMLACEEEYCVEAENELGKLGIRVMTGSQVESIEGNGNVSGVKLSNGETLPADLVIIGIGAIPNIELAEKMGIEADPRAGISVNEYLQTEDPDIFAAGDCASKFSLITGKPSGIRLASVACSEAMIAATNLFNPVRKTHGALGAFATTVGNRSIAAAGLTTKAAADEGIDVIIGKAVAPNRHPGGIPGCIADMKAKLLFRKDNEKIIGGHISGGEAAADMMNIVAVAIQSGLTAQELATMQYATHPLLTASPLFYHIMLAAENAAFELAK